MLTAKLLLWDYDDPTKKGYPIKILVTKNRKTKPVHLGRYSEPKHWNKRENAPKRSHPDPDIHTFWAQKKLDVIKISNYCNDNNLSLDESVKLFKSGLKAKTKDLTFVEFYDLRMKELTTEGKSVRIYATVKTQIEAFGDISLKKVNYEWVQDFARWKTSEGMSANGLHSYLRNLRTVFYEAQKRPSLGIDQMIKPFSGNMPRLTRTKKKAIFSTDIEAIENGNTHERVDLWLFCFYMGGMDLIDVALLKWSQLKKGRLTYQRYKLRGTGFEIDLKIFPKAQAIIEKLGTKDNERVFGWVPCPEKEETKYIYFRRNFVRRYLEPLHGLLNLTQPITNKTARHSFRTIGRQKFIDGDILKELMGHEGAGVEYIYQDRFPQKDRDEAHAKIIGEA